MPVREANLTDAEALATISVRTWQRAYQGLLPQEYLDSLDVAANHRSWQRRLGHDEHPAGTLVFEQDTGEVTGFIHVSPSRDADAPAAAEVTAIYVAPEQWGRGRGRALMQAGLSRLAGLGIGFALMVLGVALGAGPSPSLGIPLFVIGLLLTLRSLG